MKPTRTSVRMADTDRIIEHPDGSTSVERCMVCERPAEFWVLPGWWPVCPDHRPSPE